METIFGEHLTDEVFENLFADVATKLGGLQIILEIFHGTADFAKGAGFFFEITNHGGGLVEAGKKLAVVLLERGVGGAVGSVKRLLEGFEPSVESRIGFLGFQFLLQEKID